MTLGEFIFKMTENHTIEFDKSEVGYKFTVRRLTKDMRLYRIKLEVSHDMVHELDGHWDMLYKQIVEMMSDAMMKPYPDDQQQNIRNLVKYVRGFVRAHRINCSEAIHQSDEMNLMAPDFMDKCCELIGYYEEH